MVFVVNLNCIFIPLRAFVVGLKGFFIPNKDNTC